MRQKEKRTDQPLAIIGMNCRFPGNADNHHQLWENLLNQVDAVTEIPPDRWDANSYYHPDQEAVRLGYSKWGGFIENVDQFDPEVFGISPREAHQMDPQQRISLEVAYNTFLDAGYNPSSFSNQSVGVFMGVSTFDYLIKEINQLNLDDVDTYSATGTSLSIIANRISYIFDLWGPSLSVDTACSSSLMALHLAAQAIWRGDAEMALAGGVNLILEPINGIAFSKMGLLSPLGRCKAFSEEALGFVRGEGAGMVLIKPLDKAIEDGDRIYACIRATGTNQDGKTNGIAVPNQQSQEALFRQIYTQSSIPPEEIGYVEAHGTGTTVGDYIEANSIGNIIGKAGDRRKPLFIGSIKTHIGHLEAASGIAGLIKANLVLHHEKIPANLHFEKPNSNIQFKKLGLKVATKTTSFKHAKLAAVNSFGFGGANVHVILEKAPKKLKRKTRDQSLNVLNLSATSGDRLIEMAKLYYAYLQSPEVTLQETILSTNGFRSKEKFQVSIVAEDKSACIKYLKQFINDEENSKHIVTNSEESLEDIRLGFVFSGQGPQWFAMGKQLLDQNPVFRNNMEKCDEFVKKYAGWSIIAELNKPQEESKIYDTAYAQPAITCFQIALFEVFKKFGIKPKAVVGHSIGEIAAGYAAGAYNLETAIKIIVHRGATMGKYSQGGRMVAVDLPQNMLYQLAYGHDPEKLSIAAINSPTGFTFAGDESVIDEIVQKCEDQKYFGKKLRVEHAFHSAFMNPVEQPLKETLKNLDIKNPNIPMASTVTGDWVSKDLPLDSHYWWENVRKQVRFYPAVSKLIEKGINLFVEIAPHPVLLTSLHSILKSYPAKNIQVVPTIYRKENEILALGLALAKLYCLGYPVKWKKFRNRKNTTPIPGYPWSRKSYWRESYENKTFREEPFAHPLLGKRLSLQRPAFINYLQPLKFAFLDHHRFRGNILFPGTGYLESFLAVANFIYPNRWPVRLHNVRFEKGLIIPDEPGYVQTMVEYNGTNQEVTFLSRTPNNYESWTANCRATIGEQPLDSLVTKELNPERVKEKLGDSYPGELLYYHSQMSQLQFGEKFRGIQRFWRSEHEIFAEIKIPEGVDLQVEKYHFHPVLLDMTLQASSLNRVVFLDSENARYTLVPVRIDRITYLQSISNSNGKLSVYIKKLRDTPKNSLFDSYIFNDTGQCIAFLEKVELYGIEMISLDDGSNFDDWVHYLHWEELEESSHHQKHVLKPVGTVKSLQVTEHFNRIAVEETARALVDLGLKELNGQQLSIEDIISELRINRRFVPFVQKSLEEIDLRDLGIKKTKDKWKIQFNGINNQNYKSLFLKTHPEFTSFLLPILRNGSNLTTLLTDDHPSAQKQSLRWWEKNPEIYNLLLDGIGSHIKFPNIKVLEINSEDGYLAESYQSVKAIDWTICTDSGERAANIKSKFSGPNFAVHSWNIMSPTTERPWDDMLFDVIILHSDPAIMPDQAKVILFELRGLLDAGGIFWIHESLEVPYYSSLVHTDGLSFPNLVRSKRPGHLCFDSVWNSVLKHAEINYKNNSSANQSQANLWVIPEDKVENGESNPSTVKFEQDQVNLSQRVAYLVTEGIENGIKIVETINKSRLYKSVDWISLDNHKQKWPTTLNENIDIILLYQLLDNNLSFSTNYLRSNLIPGWMKVIELFQSIVQNSPDKLPKLFVFSKGAIATPPYSVEVNMRQAPIPGMISCLQSEYTDLKLKWVDLDPVVSLKDNLSIICKELSLADDIEGEIAYRNNHRLGARIKKGSLLYPDELIERENPQVIGEKYQLRIGSGNTIDSLEFSEFEPKELDDHSVEIKVHAAALNFRDVLKTLGLYPADSDDYLKLGDECSGIVSRVGGKVTDWQCGDKVIAIGSSCLASHVITHESLLFPKPSDFTFEECATIPVAFMTAYYALKEIGKLKPHDSVLIHAAAGGVGLAAIQIAQQTGAEIYATASKAKQPLLKALGVKNVYNSRDLSFADEIRRDTNDKGIDVILNSLAGEAQETSLELLAPFGRFLEIGKRDIYLNRSTGLFKFRENISFHVIDLSALMTSGSAVLKHFSNYVFEKFDRQKGYYPIPLEVFSAKQIKQAFRKMSKGEHVGKLIISFDSKPKTIKPRYGTWNPPSTEATYIISGATSGFGSEYAKFLVSIGAKNLILLSRSEPDSQKVEYVREKLKDLKDINLIPLQLDVTDEKAVKETFAEIKEAFPPIRGIIHAANVYKDQFLTNIDAESFEVVYSSKVVGAWNLHQASLDLDLDYFVLTSSIAALLGNAGQVSYASANSFIDNLAYYRKNLGLPATVVDYGPLLNTGFIARNQVIGQRLETIGVDLLPTIQALQLTEFAKNNQITRVGAYRVNFFKYWKASGLGAPTMKVKELYDFYSKTAQQSKTKTKIRSTILSMPEEQAITIVIDYVKDTVGRMLGIDSKQILDEDGFNEIGLDSLMALEMQGKLERTFKIVISPIELTREPTVFGLAKLICKQVKSGGE